MPIQIALAPESNVAASSPAMLDDVAPSTSLEWGEIIEKKKKKKEKNAFTKKVRRKVGCSSGESSDQEQDSLDDHKVIHSLMQGSILLHNIKKMIRMEDAERFDESFTPYHELGHYLFAHSKIADLHQVEVSKALQEA
ncbi:hypothetical protein COCNU_scaffold001610G000010 [Cocos nucifera]|nr:hypothetical protein [Cocos nucifera]